MKTFLIAAFLCSSIIVLYGQKLFQDIDGNNYSAVIIGEQIWMVENLKVRRYNDGSPIPQVSEMEKWSNLKSGAYCLDEKNPDRYKDTYGVLYNYYTVEDKRGLCPSGWHVPTAEEWQKLIDYLGGSSVAGGRMRDTGSDLWILPSPGANNRSGFSGIPAGGRGRFGSIDEIGYYATWWSSSSHDSTFAWHWGLFPDKNSIRYNTGHKASGFSVRCIKTE